jgi:hypothetical protein
VAGLPTTYSGRKAWLGYEPDFVYQYATINPGTTWRKFIDLAVHFSRHTRHYVVMRLTD